VEEQDELEIETRLRAALQARSELVTHSTLRPGIPPNEHTAGLRSGRQSWWSWRRLWVPVTVAAALAGGVFAGAQLNSGSNNGQTTSAANGFGNTTAPPSSGNGAGSTTPVQNAVTAGAAQNVGTLSVTVADGWQLTPLTPTSGCVTLKTRPAATPAADTSGAAAALPCGVDGLYLKSDATSAAWPLSTATSATGWWPGQTASASGLACPAVQPVSGNQVKDSELLRSSTTYTLAAKTTADFHEWAVTCDTGSGVQPMLWKLHPAAGTPAPTGYAVAAVVSADPEYDSALLGMVGSLHQAS
jgi:hypothetical protein